MSTGYSWEGIRQVRATLLGARHGRLLWCLCLLGALYQVFDLYLYTQDSTNRIKALVWYIGCLLSGEVRYRAYHAIFC